MRRVPVLSAAQIAQLPARYVVIIRRGMAPAIGKVQMAWKRPDVRRVAAAMRAARRAERWAAARHGGVAWAVDALAEAFPRFAPFAAQLRAANDTLRAARVHAPGDERQEW